MNLMSVLNRKIIRDLLRNKHQFLAIFLTIIFGNLCFVSFATSAESLKATYNKVFEEYNFEDFEVWTKPAPISIIREISNLDNIKCAEWRIDIDAGFYLNKSHIINGLVIGLNSSREPEINKLKILSGSYFNHLNSCLIEHHIADAYNLRVGDNITLIINGKKLNLTISGIVFSPEFIILMSSSFQVSVGYSYGVAYIPVELIWNILGNQHIMNKILIKVKDKNKIDETIEKVKKILGDLFIRAIKGKDLPSYSGLKADIDGFYLIAFVFSWIVLFIVGAQIYVTLSRIVTMQRQVIGTLRAIGFERREIIMHYLKYSLVIAIPAILLGLIFSPLLAKELVDFYTSNLGIPFYFIINRIEYYVIAIIQSIIICVLSSTIACYKIVRIKASEAMKPYLALMMTKCRKSIIERIISAVAPISSLTKMILRNLTRNRIRTFSTIIGIAFCTMLLFSSIAVLTSMMKSIDTQYEDYDLWDIKASFYDFKEIKELEVIRNWDGVKRIEFFASIPVRIINGSKMCQLLAINKSSKLKRLNLIEGSFEDGIVISSDISDTLGLKCGDRIIINLLGENKSVRVSGVDKEPLILGTIFIPMDVFYNLTGLNNLVNGVFISTNDEKISDIKRKLYELEGISNVLVRKEIQSEWGKVINSLSGIIYGMIFISILISGLLIFVVVIINVLDRVYEILTLRVIGYTSSEINKWLIIENILMIQVSSEQFFLESLVVNHVSP